MVSQKLGIWWLEFICLADTISNLTWIWGCVTTLIERKRGRMEGTKRGKEEGRKKEGRVEVVFCNLPCLFLSLFAICLIWTYHRIDPIQQSHLRGDWILVQWLCDLHHLSGKGPVVTDSWHCTIPSITRNNSRALVDFPILLWGA